MNQEPTRTYYVVRNAQMGRVPMEREFFTVTEARASEADDARRYPNLGPFVTIRCDVFESAIHEDRDNAR